MSLATILHRDPDARQSPTESSSLSVWNVGLGVIGHEHKRRLPRSDTRRLDNHTRNSEGARPRGFESLRPLQDSAITRENVTGSIVPSLPRVSARSCASWPLRERIPCTLYAPCRSFLRTRLCQWLSLRMMVLITGRACTAIAFVFRKACPSLPIITSTGSQHHGTSKPNEMHARMNMPTGAATRRDIYQRMLEKIRP